MIKPGDRIPDNFPRLKEGLRRGWIAEVTQVEGLPLTPTVEPATILLSQPKIEEMNNSVVEGELSESHFNLSSLISNFEFLSVKDISELNEKGIIEISNLEGWTVEQLTELRGIGVAKANKLLDAYSDYMNSLKSF
jgi:hypothetical protein